MTSTHKYEDQDQDAHAHAHAHQHTKMIPVFSHVVDTTLSELLVQAGFAIDLMAHGVEQAVAIHQHILDPFRRRLA